MKLTHLRVNHMIEPVIDDNPEFSFFIESEKRNTFLESRRIRVYNGNELFWDSGEIFGRRQSFIRYEGRRLKSRTVYTCEISARSNHGETAAAVCSFETGLYPEDWKAMWCVSPFERNEHRMLSDGIVNPVVSFTRTLNIPKQIKKARLYASCIGVYRLLVNGIRPDDRELAPEFTPYSKILNYQTYDISSMLNVGGNSLEMLVGDGWYFNSQTVPVGCDRKAQAVIWQLELEYADGSCRTVVPDGSEKCRLTNIIWSDLFVGEKIDLTAPYSQSASAIMADYGYAGLTAQKQPPVRAVEILEPKEIIVTAENETIIDFGQVIAGRCRVVLDEPAGTEVILKHTEVLENGRFFAATAHRQRDNVICPGGRFEYEPLFTFHGFRYVLVSGVSDLRPENFKAVLLSTEKENRGSFTCNDGRFNRLYSNIRYSQKNNMLSIPTDCPQREKAGWTGDVLVYSRTAMLNEEMTPFFRSWMRGMMQDQDEKGAIPIVTPYTKMYCTMFGQIAAASDTSTPSGIDMALLPPGAPRDLTPSQCGVAGWSDAVIQVPWDAYQVNGNRTILEECLPSMIKWVDNIISVAAQKRNAAVSDAEDDRWLWNTGFHFGEWLVPGHEEPGFDECPKTSWYIAPFYGYISTKRLADILEILGDNERSGYYASIAARMKTAINNAVLPLGTQYDDFMGRYAIAIAYEIADDDIKPVYKKKLIELVEKGGCRLGTGFLGTPVLLDALEKAGRPDLACAILKQEDKPSWLYEVKMGGTAIWESWGAINEDGTPNKISFDHYAFGVVDDFIFRRICGINALKPGFDEILIAPDVSYGFDDVTRSYISEHGEIRVHYSGRRLDVKIPANTGARIIWQNVEYCVGNGTYSFE